MIALLKNDISRVSTFPHRYGGSADGGIHFHFADSSRHALPHGDLYRDARGPGFLWFA